MDYSYLLESQGLQYRWSFCRQTVSQCEGWCLLTTQTLLSSNLVCNVVLDAPEHKHYRKPVDPTSDARNHPNLWVCERCVEREKSHLRAISSTLFTLWWRNSPRSQHRQSVCDEDQLSKQQSCNFLNISFPKMSDNVPCPLFDQFHTFTC